MSQKKKAKSLSKQAQEKVKGGGLTLHTAESLRRDSRNGVTVSRGTPKSRGGVTVNRGVNGSGSSGSSGGSGRNRGSAGQGRSV